MYLSKILLSNGQSAWGRSTTPDGQPALLNDFRFDEWLRQSAGRVADAIAEIGTLDARQMVGQVHRAAPLESQEVWAAGVTYERSREARQEEAQDGGDVYARVYAAARPELFFKALPRNVIGPGGEVGIRADATWNVPEPELAVLLNPALEVVGFTIGNDMSSRDIEGENPLYLPQAKVYDASCGLGPALLLMHQSAFPRLDIAIAIFRQGMQVFSGATHTERLHRTLPDLAGYLGRSSTHPNGVILLTGTGIVPPLDFTLAAGDRIDITIASLGTLSNTVKVV
jgi:2-dehydro-3-deoxy-D-arabinonate dehydratase